jgi:hypothetical protein
VGQVDVLVGVPTLNHADTIGPVMAAVQASFGTTFARQRTVLVNSDGGSTDGTTAITRDRSAEDRETFTTSHGLRTTHRISAPYHGVGIQNAVHQLFAIADLLQATTIVVLDPDAMDPSPGWVAALGTPVRDRGFDFVAPLYQRQPADAPLVTQLVRPLFGAIYGHRLAEPLAGEFACSGRFARQCLETLGGTAGTAGSAVGLWLAGAALSGGFTVCQAPVGPRTVTASRPRPALPALFQDVVTALFGTIAAHSDYWLARSDATVVPTVGTPPAPPAGPPAVSGSSLVESFADDVENLGAILRPLLGPSTFESLLHASRANPPDFPDGLWAATVMEFLLAYRHHVIRQDHVAQALLPLYKARAGIFVHEHASDDTEAAARSVDALFDAFESVRPIAVERWTVTSTR